MAQIRIAWKGGEVIANLRETPSVNQLVRILPCEASANTWGDEVYFELPLKLQLEADAQQVVEPGTVCFWVEGHSLALPFGPTPASKGQESRLVTRCNVLGNIAGDPRELKKVKAGTPIRVERVL
ncbi:MAG TPA: cyclophilin-like fold protein [Burkholderiales bacterium]|nr:cyclophilin-like fold protein [Burkholderiales bacterium]